jgi:hypothetical protein
MLLMPDTESYIYYHTMQLLLPTSVMFYNYAILRALVNLLCLGTLFTYAFNIKQFASWFWRPLFMARIATDFFGHNYELQTLKSAFYGEKGVLIATLVFYGLLIFPSYYAHYVYAFRKTKEDPPPDIVRASG